MVFYRYSYDCRFNIESGPNPMTYHPVGFWDTTDSRERNPRINITNGYGPEWYSVIFNTPNTGWAVITGPDGSYMYKFPMLTEKTLEYKSIRFLYDGIWYVLEIRIAEIDEIG